MHACSTAHRSLRAHTIGAPRPPCAEPRSPRTAHTRTPRAAPGLSAAGLCGPRAPSPGRRRRNGRALPRSSPAPGTHLRGKTERSRRGASQPSLALGTGPPAPRAGSRAPSPFLQHRAVAPRRSALPSAAAPSPHAVLAPGARLWRPGCTPPRASACPGTDVRGLWVRQRVALCPARGPPRGTPQRMAQPSPPAARGRGHGATGTEQSPSLRPGAWRAARSPGKGPPPAPRAGCSPLLSSSASFLPARPALPLPASLNPFANPAFPEPFVLRSAPGLLSPRPSAHPTALRVQWSPRAAGKASGRCGQRAETRGDGPEQRPRSAHTKAAMALCCAVLCCRAGARRPEERLQGWWQPHNRGLDGE